MSTTDKFTKKLLKLSKSITDTTNYLQLQQVIDTFNTIKSSYQTISNKYLNHQNNLQFSKLFDTTQQLIKQKIKYFKKKALQKLQSGQAQLKQTNHYNHNNNNDHYQKTHISSNTKQRLNSSPSINNKSHKYNNQLSNATVIKQSNSKRKKQTKKHDLSQQNEQDNSIFSQRKDNYLKKSHTIQNSNSSKRLKQSKSVDNLFDRRGQKQKEKQSITFKDGEGFYDFVDEDNVVDHNMSKGKKRVVIDESQFGSWKKSRGRNDPNINSSNSKMIDFDDQKTQIKMGDRVDNNNNVNGSNSTGYNNNRNYGRYGNNDEMQKMMQWMCTNNNKGSPSSSQQSYVVIQSMRRKLWDKISQLEQVKGRLRYFQSQNSQLKKRVLNEQRRQQDYIISLRQKIRKYQQEQYSNQRQKKMMTHLIQQLQFKMNTQQKQIINYNKQLEQALKQKQLTNQQSKTQTTNLKKELQLLSKHHTSLQDLQSLLRQQKLTTQITKQKNMLLTKQLKQVSEHVNILVNDKLNLQELLEIKLQEILAYQQQIYQLKKSYSQQEEDNHSLGVELQALRQRQAEWLKKRDNQHKRKIQKLKQVKTLLGQEL